MGKELPSVACSQIPPLLEEQVNRRFCLGMAECLWSVCVEATAALASVLTQVEPLLTGRCKFLWFAAATSCSAARRRSP